jgi:hypothetical protein
MGWKQRILDAANAPLSLLGARLVPAREHAQMARLRESLGEPLKFTLGSTTFDAFAHRYNCGWPYLATHTERSVELAVADYWLSLVPANEVTEIGAVTPYYWPRRVSDIVDPTDAHPLVARREGIETIDLTGRSVLSISTFEHIGRGDYGLTADLPAAGRALDKLFQQSQRFLVTFAAGYNSWLDEHILTRSEVEVRLLVRDVSGIGWAEREPRRENLRPYSSAGGNAVFFLHRGTSLFGGTR